MRRANAFEQHKPVDAFGAGTGIESGHGAAHGVAHQHERLEAQAVDDGIEIGEVDGGCYGVPGSVRATVDSLMNSSIPVLGSQNRRWAEQILDLWTGD